MPIVLNPQTGLNTRIPGVYFKSEAVSSQPGPIPDFHVPIIVGDADEGHPYNADTLKYADEDDFTPFALIGEGAAVGRYYGNGSPIHVATRYAKDAGLPTAYFCCASALTRASVVATSGTKAVNELYLYPYSFGPAPSYVKIKFSSSTLTVTPVRRATLLTANGASGAKRIYVRDNSWIQVGMTLTIGDNDTAVASVVVAGVGVELNSSGQRLYYVDLASALGATFATADYAVLLAYDTDIVSPATLSNANLVYEYVRNTLRYQGRRILGATKHADYTGAALDSLATATALLKVTSSDWTNATVATAPASSITQHNAIITALNASEWDAFLTREQVRPQAFLVVSPTSAVHSAWSTWAATRRAAGWPVSITAGCSWGDTSTSASNDTSAVYRAQALNSEDFCLVAGGIDRLASYLSHAPQVFARRVAGGVGHNLTNDDLVYDEIETEWDEVASAQLTTLHRAGVVTYRLSRSRPFRYVISQGLSTYQTNDAAWDTVDAKTCLVMQRDLADAINEVLSADLDSEQLGVDEVTPNSIAAVVLRRCEVLQQRRRWIKPGYSITSITLDSSGNGYNVVFQVTPRVTNDFITGTARILVE